MMTTTRKAILRGILAGAFFCAAFAPQAVSAATWKPSVSTSYATYVRVSWSSRSGANTYYLYRSKSSNMAGAVLVYKGSKTSFLDKSAFLGYKYYYKVKAANCCSPGMVGSSVAAGYRKMTLKVNTKRSGNKLWVGATVNGLAVYSRVDLDNVVFTRSGVGASSWRRDGRYFGAEKDSNWYFGYFTSSKKGLLKFRVKLGKTLIVQLLKSYRW